MYDCNTAIMRATLLLCSWCTQSVCMTGQYDNAVPRYGGFFFQHQSNTSSAFAAWHWVLDAAFILTCRGMSCGEMHDVFGGVRRAWPVAALQSFPRILRSTGCRSRGAGLDVMWMPALKDTCLVP